MQEFRQAVCKKQFNFNSEATLHMLSSTPHALPPYVYLYLITYVLGFVIFVVFPF
jgi:hypothetical protein